MYQKVNCITLNCDRCKEYYTNSSGFSIHVDENNLKEEALEDGWYMFSDNGKHYCPSCYTIDEGDNFIIKPLEIKEE